MPKITETTVAEHRAVQHRAVLEAAEQLIVAGGGKVPSLAEVAAEVGLARSARARRSHLRLRGCHARTFRARLPRPTDGRRPALPGSVRRGKGAEIARWF